MRVGFLYQGPHECHKKWADAIDAEYVYYQDEIKNEYDAILIEAGRPLWNAVRFKRKNPETKLIYLNADETFLVWKERLLRMQGILYFPKILYGVKRTDGIISVSNLVRLDIGIPEYIVRPFITKKYDFPRYNPSNRNVVSIGYYAPKQGIDMLVNAFNIVKSDNDFADLRLFLVGKGYPKFYERSDIILPGFVDDLADIYKSAGLYVHAGRYQACPIAPVEAMHYGIPAILTDKTGSSEVLQSSLVSRPNRVDLADKIKWFFSLEDNEKLKLSEYCFEKSLGFLEQDAVDRFKRCFWKLVSE